MPRVYGYWPGISSGRAGRSSDVYSGSTGTPEIVDVSMPSLRLEALESNSSCHTCLGSFARTFTWNSLCELAQDLLCDFVRSSVLEKALRQPAVVRQRRPGPLPGQLGHHLRGLVAQPLLGLGLR